MPKASPTKAMEKTSITNNPSPKVALIIGLISGWSLQEQIEVLQETLTEVSNLKRVNENAKRGNDVTRTTPACSLTVRH